MNVKTLGAGYRLGLWMRTLNLRRRLRKLPRTRIADLDENPLGKIIGTVAADGPVLEAPLTKRLCVYYALEIKKYEYKEESTIVDDQRAVPFVLDDGSAHAHVDTETAQISATFDHAVRIVAGKETYAERRLLAEWGLPIDGRVSLAYYLREATIELDQQICIVGAGVRELTPSPRDGDGGVAYRDGTRTQLHLSGSERFPLVISDDPRVLK